MRMADTTEGRSGTSRTTGFDASHEMEFSTRNAAPRLTRGSDQLTGWRTLAVPKTTARGPWDAPGPLGPSLAMARASGPERSPLVFSGPSNGHFDAPVTFVTPNPD